MARRARVIPTDSGSRGGAESVDDRVEEGGIVLLELELEHGHGGSGDAVVHEYRV
jgi:hypothetical protein